MGVMVTSQNLVYANICIITTERTGDGNENKQKKILSPQMNANKRKDEVNCSVCSSFVHLELSTVLLDYLSNENKEPLPFPMRSFADNVFPENLSKTPEPAKLR
jgi:hypothetical protein